MRHPIYARTNTAPMHFKLSILIPTLSSRWEVLKELIDELNYQIQSKPVQTKPAATKTAATKKAVKVKSVEAKPAAWRTYGPLQVDWSNWQSMGGSMVAPTLNSEGKPLYVAVNCSARKINVTSSDGAWKSWIAPQTNFEKDLVKDRCIKTA